MQFNNMQGGPINQQPIGSTKYDEQMTLFDNKDN